MAHFDPDYVHNGKGILVSSLKKLLEQVPDDYLAVITPSFDIGLQPPTDDLWYGYIDIGSQTLEKDLEIGSYDPFKSRITISKEAMQRYHRLAIATQELVNKINLFQIGYEEYKSALSELEEALDAVKFSAE